MLVGVGKAWWRTAGAAVLVSVLAGCSGTAETDAGSSPSPTASPSVSPAEEVRSGGRVGAAGSACLLPVGFDLAAEWKADAIDGSAADAEADGGDAAEVDEDLASLLRQGPVTLVCEIDAKPAGHLGFLRVYTGESGKGGDARAVLQAFVTAQDGAKKARYSTFEAGGLPGVAVEYLATSELLDGTKQESAFAVVTPDGPVVVHLGGADTEEHQDMLPAFELARKTLRTG
ncbi:lipoprotein [Streptomyces sp. NBC_00028]